MDNKIITYVSFAKKAGFLSLGFDAVKSVLVSKSATLIILLNDASDKTKNAMQKISKQYHTKCVILPLKSSDFIHIFYKKIVVFSINDKNLSTAILNCHCSVN